MMIMILTLAVMAQSLGILNFLIPAAAAYYASKSQSDAQDNATNASNAATAAQQQVEANKQKRLDELSNLAKSFIYGENPVQGSLEPAQDWSTRLLTFLRDSPDYTYNQQKGILERGVASARGTLDKNLARRGLSTSGLAAGGASDIDLSRSQGLAGLIGDRETRRGQNLTAGYGISQDALNRALNMFKQGATGQAVGLQSLVPQMMQATAANSYNMSQQPNAGSDILTMAVQQALNKTQAPSTVASPNIPTVGGSTMGNIGTSIAKALFGYK